MSDCERVQALRGKICPQQTPLEKKIAIESGYPYRRVFPSIPTGYIGTFGGKRGWKCRARKREKEKEAKRTRGRERERERNKGGGETRETGACVVISRWMLRDQ